MLLEAISANHLQNVREYREYNNIIKRLYGEYLEEYRDIIGEENYIRYKDFQNEKMKKILFYIKNSPVIPEEEVLENIKLELKEVTISPNN